MLFRSGRARSASTAHGEALDNGQHILIGAYQATLDLMRTVGVDPEEVLLRRPLQLCNARGEGLRLPGGPPWLAFARGVLTWQGVPWPERLGLLRMAAGWQWRGFRCAPDLTVRDFAADCPPTVWSELIEPLCVAALNTPADQASAQVMLRVLQDALFLGAGSADLLLPRAPLSALLPTPALHWLKAHGATVHMPSRVRALTRHAEGAWSVDGQPSGGVILACTPTEAARLLDPWAPDWSRQARSIGYQPIATVWLEAGPVNWPGPMIRLSDGPAQFAFDLGRLGGPSGRYALVASGALEALDAGTDRKSTRLNSSHSQQSRMPSSA